MLRKLRLRQKNSFFIKKCLFAIEFEMESPRFPYNSLSFDCIFPFQNLELKTSSNTLEKMIKESQASRESFQKAKLEFEKEKNDLLDEKKTTEDNLKTAQTKNDLLQENIEEVSCKGTNNSEDDGLFPNCHLPAQS